MSYLALYRKYRPTNFKNVEGQDTVVRVLVNSINTNHISHAYLFTGPRGTGKTSIAKIFAKAVNCLDFKDDICDKCDICQALKDNDSDIIEIDAASNNGVDEIRSLRDNVKLMPSFCKYKIYIIDEVHMLSAGAFNALLKTLEEPPSHVIFILATTEPQKIPLTILSRCQRFDFNRLSVPNIVHRLNYILDEEKLSLPDNIVEYIASSSDGCLRDAVNLLDQTLSLNKTQNIMFDDIDNLSGKISMDTIFSLLDALVNRDYTSLVNMSNDFSATGKNLIDIFDKLLTVLRDISLNINIKNYFDSKYSQKLDLFNINNDQILSISNVINSAISEIRYSNNQKILFDIYMMQISNLFTNSDNSHVESIIDNKNSFDDVISNKEDFLNKNQNIKNDVVLNVESEDKVDESVEKVEFKDTDKSSFDNTSLSIKEIRINNTLASADKSILKEINDNLDKLDKFLTNKKYVGIIDLINDSKIVVAGCDYLLFSFSEAGNVSIFDSNITKVESLFKQAFDKTYKVCAVSDSEWNSIREEYINNKKNNISYTIIEENVVKLDKKPKDEKALDSASSLFGDDVVNLK